MWLLVAAFFVVLITYAYFTITRKYGSFEAQGIFEPPKYFPFGTTYNWQVMTGRRPFFKALDELYAQYGKDHEYLGTFANSSPVLVVNDLDKIKNILVKDFDHFVDRRVIGTDTTKEENKIVANMLTMITGEKWKKVRSLMSPAFTSGKLKGMRPHIDKVGDELVEHVRGVADRDEQFSAKEVLTSYTLDCIASCGFGVEANSFKEPDGTFRKMVLQATGGDSGRPKLFLNAMIAIMFPSVAKALKLSFIDGEAILFFADVVRKAVALRRKQKTKRNDMIDLVLEALENSDEVTGPKEDQEAEDQFEKDASIAEGSSNGFVVSKEEYELLLISNAVVLFFAGFDTTSSALSMTLAYLARYPDIQEKLFREISDAAEASGKDKLDYYVVQDLPYLDAVLMETLHYYFSGTIERVCSKDYKLPGTDFVVPKGMLVQIPGSAIHKDERFYPDPCNFNPEENFSEEARAKRSPYTFMGFGQGPRNCIGMRFAQLMAKMCLARLVADFELAPGPKMPASLDMSMNINGMPKGGVWLKAKRRS